MQSDLVIKENELIDPSNYPEDQRNLVEDFNSRIRRLMGIITGIGKEYHTIWIFRNLEAEKSVSAPVPLSSTKTIRCLSKNSINRRIAVYMRVKKYAEALCFSDRSKKPCTHD
ncbi:MAG: hypothetical protein K5877_04800 [Lachnospiraceae bacterium]|nr:hypothetical protein [Lachnospiraceae bacterium]